MTNDERGQGPTSDAAGWPHEPEQGAAWGRPRASQPSQGDWREQHVGPPEATGGTAGDPTPEHEDAHRRDAGSSHASQDADGRPGRPQQPQQSQPGAGSWQSIAGQQARRDDAAAQRPEPGRSWGPSVPMPTYPAPSTHGTQAGAEQHRSAPHADPQHRAHHATGASTTGQHPASQEPTVQQPYAQHAAGAYGQAAPGQQEPWWQQPAAERPRRRRRRGPALVATFALLGGTVLGGAAGATAATLVAQQHQEQAASSADGVTVSGAVATDPSTIAQVAQTASQSVVTVQASSQSGSGTGSGVVVGEGGIIVTNNHVVTLDGAVSDAQVTVETTDGRLLAATIVGTDPTVDLAVLQVDADLPVASFADSTGVAVGDTAIAIGAPLGLSTTVTDGIVSATDRGLQISSSATEEETPEGQQSPFGFWNQQGTQTPAESIAIPVVQTDASINPGNSGGALLDASGQLIGINVAIASLGQDASSSSGSIGIGFAIEASLVQRVVEEIVATGTATHGLLGASVTDVTDTAIGQVGAQLAEVPAGGAAADAGLRVGDVVTAVDGRPVTSATDLTAQVRAAAGGATVTLAVLRDGSEQDVDVQLATL